MIYIILAIKHRVNLNADIFGICLFLLSLELSKLILKFLYDHVFFLYDFLMIDVCNILISGALSEQIFSSLLLMYQFELKTLRGLY